MTVPYLFAGLFSLLLLLRITRRVSARVFTCAMLVLAVLQLEYLLVVALNPHELVPGVWMVRVANCSLDYHTLQVQPQRTLVLACRGRDQLRLWPWPLKHPWRAHAWGDADEVGRCG